VDRLTPSPHKPILVSATSASTTAGRLPVAS
jgi:hypothetical protein